MLFCWCLLLLLVLTSTTCSCADAWQPSDGLQQEVATTLGVTIQQLAHSISSWDSRFTVQRRLVGTGFHRTMEYKVQFATLASEELLACQHSLLQYLPSSFYADPYQLEDMLRPLTKTATQGQDASENNDASSYASSTGIKESAPRPFHLLGPVNLELPAPACRPTTLLLRFNATQHSLTASEAVLSVPLHVKYPEPLSFRYSGWQALLTGHVGVILPWPLVVVDCRSTGGQLQVLQAPGVLADRQQQQQTCVDDERTVRAADECKTAEHDELSLVWDIPTGSLDQLHFVSWATLVITAACSVALCVKAVRIALNVR